MAFFDAFLAAVIAISSPTPPGVVPSSRVECMAMTAFGEARDQPDAGVRAVLHTMLNRERDRDQALCDVAMDGYDGMRHWVRQPKHPMKVDPESYARLAGIALYVDLGLDRESNCATATHFYNPDLASPRWARVLEEVCVIGNHRFMIENS